MNDATQTQIYQAKTHIDSLIAKGWFGWDDFETFISVHRDGPYPITDAEMEEIDEEHFGGDLAEMGIRDGFKALLLERINGKSESVSVRTTGTVTLYGKIRANDFWVSSDSRNPEDCRGMPVDLNGTERGDRLSDSIRVTL